MFKDNALYNENINENVISNLIAKLLLEYGLCWKSKGMQNRRFTYAGCIRAISWTGKRLSGV